MKDREKVDIRPTPSSRTQEEENVIFEGMIAKYGAFTLEEKIQKLEMARRYYRRFPYDAWAKRTGMDSVDLTMPTQPHDELESHEAREALLMGLTPRELEVALWSEQGLKPRDMAKLRGDDTSNADRWMKHRVKQRFEERLAEIKELEEN